MTLFARPLAVLSLCLAAATIPAGCKRGAEAPPPEPELKDGFQVVPGTEGPLILSQWEGAPVKGLVSRAQGTNEPPAGSALKVQLWGGAAADSKVLAEKSFEVTAPAPWAFEITLPEGTFNPEHSYGLGAMVTDPAGDIWFSSMPVPILRVDSEQTIVEIVLDPMDKRANDGTWKMK